MNTYFYYAETKNNEVLPPKFVNGTVESTKTGKALIEWIHADLFEKWGHHYVVMSLSKL